MLGETNRQRALLDAEQVCGHLVAEGSIYRTLAAVGDQLFSDADFADLYDASRGRASVPPALVAKVLLLQSLEGTSDRETLDRVRCDLRWKVALGLSVEDEGFHPTVLVYFRERLRRSAQPRRIFERFKAVASQAGLLSRRGTRVLDSTPVLSAVQTEDTVSLIRGAMRRLLTTLGASDRAAVQAIADVLQRTDYAQTGKPAIDWDDEAARATLVDELVTDALATLLTLERRALTAEAREAAELLATVAGQDVDYDDRTGDFRLRRGVAAGRVISTVDPEARHGHKTSRGHFDGYKAHVAVEPDSELISEITLTAANVPDATAVTALLPELTDDAELTETEERLTVVGDSAYGQGATRADLAQHAVRLLAKALPERNSTGGFLKSAFTIDLMAGTATCPAGVTTTEVQRMPHVTRFRFPAAQCAACAVRASCTKSATGRTVEAGPYESLLATARAQQRTAVFRAEYTATRPTVERVIARLVCRGGRKARYRGRLRVGEQVTLKAAAENLARMGRLGLRWTELGGWAVS